MTENELKPILGDADHLARMICKCGRNERDFMMDRERLVKWASDWLAKYHTWNTRGGGE